MIKTADIKQMTKLANDLELAGFYEEADAVDGLIKEAGIFRDMFGKLWTYIKDWGVRKLVDYVAANPNSIIAGVVKRLLNKTDNITEQDMLDYINRHKNEQPVEPGTVVPEAAPVPAPVANKEQVLVNAIAQQTPTNIRYTKKNGQTGEYSVIPKEIMEAGMRMGKTYEKTLWAEHDGKVHSYVFDKVEII